ncbi:hypothetical protein HZS_6055 [Henneguya salminicola]|nr:hypothetical protein HZS_6055 [Henneguya salminicola]
MDNQSSPNDLAISSNVDYSLKPYLIHILYKNEHTYNTNVFEYLLHGNFPLNRLKARLVRNHYTISLKIDFDEAFKNATIFIQQLSDYLNNHTYFSKASQFLCI